MGKIGFHEIEQRIGELTPLYTTHEDTQFTYTFENFFHPYVGDLIGRLNQKALAGVLDPDWLAGLTTDFFLNAYPPLPSQLVKFTDYPKREIDVHDISGAGPAAVPGPYANYNWELFFHIPLTIAVHLSKNQRFAEAQRWFHYIFDPTCNDTSIPTPQRYWKFLRFRPPYDTTARPVGDLLALLSKPDNECSQDELNLKNAVLTGYSAILNDPFQPHKVARTRPIAYQYSVVMKYLDNLIAWGDSLFTQDTIESINEATQIYILAANLLGARPEQVPAQGIVRPKTYAQLKAAGLDAMGNAMVDLEGQFPFNFARQQGQNQGGDQGGALFGIGRTLYFCIPRNQKMLGYWDIVADRLFKLRHCMNIEGVVQQLALFDPPIDPGMLVKAAAAGIDVAGIVSGINQPIGPVRCLTLIQKALEITSEVRGLGTALLAALEKGDSEHLAVMKQGHEIQIQQLTQDVKFLQWKQAQAQTEALLKTRASALERYKYYLRLLGQAPDTNVVPDAVALDRRELTEDSFDDAYSALVGQYDKAIAIQTLPPLGLAGGSSPSNQSGGSGQGNLYLNMNEDAELNTHLPRGRDERAASSALDTVASAVTMIPTINVDLHFWGMGAHSKVFDGVTLAAISRIAAEILRTTATWEKDQGDMASKTAGYQRRADEWMHQANLAARELMQIGRQIITSLIAEQVAHHEYLNIQTQIANSKEVNQFLQDKFTNEELYGWLQGETARLFYEYYRFAVDVARRAERTMKQELMRAEVDATDYIQVNYWDGGRKGLLSGEALHLDVKRMELAYYGNNKREFEMTRHVSLRQLDPQALLSLKVTGRCEVTIPEWLFDRDCPGHYMRRIKTVALSLPSVVGPYTSVNCTLTLLRSSVRKSPLLKDGGYARTGGDDDRFVDYVGAVQSIVTSGGSSDGGMFETNLRDERFLPFEGAGAAESRWRLELPGDFQPFDYMTISDAILHVRYTARQGGAPLGDAALSELHAALSGGTLGFPLLFSLRYDFPTEWAAFVNSANSNFKVRLQKAHFPYMAQGSELTIDSLALFASSAGTVKRRSVTAQEVDLTALSNDLNGTNKYSDLVTLAADSTVLKRDAEAQVFLVIGFHF